MTQQANPHNYKHADFVLRFKTLLEMYSGLDEYGTMLMKPQQIAEISRPKIKELANSMSQLELAQIPILIEYVISLMKLMHTMIEWKNNAERDLHSKG